MSSSSTSFPPGILTPLLPPVGNSKPTKQHLTASERRSIARFEGAVLDESKGIAPGALLSPNFVYAGGSCVTETLSVYSDGGLQCTAAAAEEACAFKSAACLDAVTRGLLSGLQPVVRRDDSVTQQ